MSEALLETAQAVLTGYDTALNKQFREEDRKWRSEDIAWRSEERFYNESSMHHMQLERAWHQEDVDQRYLDNIRYLWQRYVDRTRSDMEERSEQLKGISNLAALVAGFAVSGFLQFTISADMTSSGVFFAFGISTALVTGLMLNTMMICTLIQASILKTGRKFVSEWEEASFEWLNQYTPSPPPPLPSKEWLNQYTPGKRPPQPQKMFSRHWEQQCEGEWVRAFFMFSAGVPIFFANLALAGWIKFHFDVATAVGITVVMGTALAYFVLSQFRWVSHILEKNMDPQTFDTSTVSRLPFDWHLPPQAFKRRRSNLHHPSQGMQSHMTQQSGEGVPPGEGIPETTEETPQGAYEDVPPDVVHGDINIAMPDGPMESRNRVQL